MSTAPATRPAPPPVADEAALHAALASGERPARPGPLSAALTFAWRAGLKVKHVPEQLLDVTITPVLFLVMFTYLFGGAVEGSTGDYLQYILPGMLVQSVLFTCVYSGVAVNTDVDKGVIDRFRSLPIWRPAPLVGAAFGDAVRYVIAAVVVVLVGMILGYRADAGVPGTLLAIGLVVLFAFGLAWVFTTVGLVLRSPAAVLNGGFLMLFPLVFLSNIFVDPETLPGALEWFVSVNPVSHVTTAARGLMDGEAATGDIALVLAEAAVLTAIFAPLTVRLYARRA